MRRVSRRFDDQLKRFRALFSVRAILLLVSVAQAQQTAPPAKPQTEKPEAHRIHAVRINDPIKIDGLLNEAAWASAEAASDFRQERPTEGAPASEKTEVRVLYDNALVFNSRLLNCILRSLKVRDWFRNQVREG